ncbi:hypothetical protein AB0F81_41840 [Actinoplanes sp. NPDC024001]|uniref:hypothetical protein n=1 Tax=Actinoplanes sp. NPDC024001 TaxID=3154598 RepID=UPI0033C48348
MEIAAIITGLLAVLAGFLPGLSSGRRAFAILGGAGFAVYGIYVLNQESGTYTFPIYLFLLPIFILLSAASGARNDE